MPAGRDHAGEEEGEDQSGKGVGAAGRVEALGEPKERDHGDQEKQIVVPRMIGPYAADDGSDAGEQPDRRMPVSPRPDPE